MRLAMFAFEQGFITSNKLKELAKEKCIQAGGLPALRVLYPWHPDFQAKDEGVGDIFGIDGVAAQPISNAANTYDTGGSSPVTRGRGSSEDFIEGNELDLNFSSFFHLNVRLTCQFVSLCSSQQEVRRTTRSRTSNSS